MSLLLCKLDLAADASAIFDHMVDEPWSVWLDSGYPSARAGRFDILSCCPMSTLLTHEGITTVSWAGREPVVASEPPLDLLREALGPVADGVAGLPFCGGALGYFSYDLARNFEVLPAIAPDLDCMPEMAIGIYDWAVIVDHGLGAVWLVSQGRASNACEVFECWKSRLGLPPPARARQFSIREQVVPDIGFDDYAAAFAKVQQYLVDGDCYQINLTQRFSGELEGDVYALYRALRDVNAAPFSAFLNFPFAQILSASPERFLKLSERRVESRPIKGTRPRDGDELLDQARRRELERSEKDRAENLMIVDLLRNDLGRTCMPGSISVPELFNIESYATVHHLVSAVVGTLADNRDALDLMRLAFPGGSITGAPKIRAMEIIEELEVHRRGVYCGSIGYISFDGDMDTSIVIRTLVHCEGRVHFWVGGGIVIDSVLEEEYQECFDKALAIFRALEAGSKEAV